MKRFPFAPGVIDRTRPGRSDAIGRFILMVACLAAFCLVVGFTAGYFHLPGMLP